MKTKTATERMEAARAHRRAAYQERNLLIGLLTRIWPAHLAQSAKRQVKGWEWIVCVHAPAGQLAWRITDEELPIFDHLKRTENDWDKHTTADKIDRITLMITSGVVK